MPLLRHREAAHESDLLDLPTFLRAELRGLPRPALAVLRALRRAARPVLGELNCPIRNQLVTQTLEGLAPYSRNELEPRVRKPHERRRRELEGRKGRGLAGRQEHIAVRGGPGDLARLQEPGWRQNGCIRLDQRHGP